MRYNVIIALNSVGQRKVGQIISILEGRGLEFQEIIKKMSQSFGKEFPSVGQLIFQAKLKNQEVMNFYQEKFDTEVLDKKIKHFYRNHVELSFDSGEKNFDSNELWEDIAEHVFDRGRKLPIMFVVAISNENGIGDSFFPNDFEPDYHYYFNPRTVIPLGK